MMRTRVLFVIGIPFACVIFLMLFINTDLKRKVYKITSFETTSKPRVNSSFLDSLYTQPTDQSRTSPAINNMPTSPLQENYNLKRKFCSMKFENGEMCPPLYTDLGGQCGRNGSGFLYCEDVRRLGSQSLRQAQLAITRLLGLFDNIARKYNVTYWITSATLLGAARHKGFIPWDSDADIEIPLDEYEKFFRNGSADLPKDVFFQNTESDHELRPPAQTYEAHKYKDIGMYIRTWNPRIRDRKSCYKYCIANGCKWHDGLMVDIYVVESVPEGSYPLKELIFEGISLPVQNNWKDVLKGKYGADYMEVPKEGYKNRQQWDWPDPDHSCEELQSN